MRPGRTTLFARQLPFAAALSLMLSLPRVAASAAPVPDATPEPCAAEVQLDLLLARDPEMAARRELTEALIRAAQAKGMLPTGATASSNIVYTIPVAVHIVHSGGIENLSYPQIQSQIAAINRDLQNTPGNVPPATDCQIQFCLASQVPFGSTVQWASVLEPGVTRTQSAQSIVDINNDAALKAVDYLPSDRYLNVWVVKRIDNGSQQGLILGYATFPGTVLPTLDGIVMDYRVMGANGMGFGNFSSTLLASNDQGKVFAHEVGHWLDLFHTFHGGCSVGDQVLDTPVEANNHWGCPSGSPTTVCSNTNVTAPIHNFMEYTNDPCRWEFTPGQKVRMFAAINNFAMRSKLVSPANLVATGACPPNLFAVINLGTSQACAGVPVACSGPPCGTCTYTWNFPVAPFTASGQNTSVTFNTPGTYTIQLTMSDGSNSSTATATIYVNACTAISGACTNWVWSTGCRLDFASGTPVPVLGTLNAAFETASQVSDPSGNLAFYTDGSKVWRANNTLMPNGTGLIGGNSSHNGALVVPMPGSSTKYYIFQVRQFEDGEQNDPLHYTVVDMGLNDVVVAQKNVNIPLPGTPRRLIEGMTLVPHCNGTDWWLITHGADAINANNDWNKFIYVTLITATAVGPSQSFPIGVGGLGGPYSAWGAITASKDGSMIAVVQAKAQAIVIYDFNRATGTPSVQVNTGNIDANHDVAFSPNGNILYYCYQKPGFTDRWGLRQYNRLNGQIRTLTTPTSPGGDLDVRLGPDGKIYVAPQLSNTLHCVNNPDVFNTLNLNECGFNPNSIALGTGPSTTFYATLPNILPVCSATPQAAAFSMKVTNCFTVAFTTPNCGPWTWNFGDGSGTSSLPAPTHVYAPGTYTVTLTAPSAFPTVIQKIITIGNAPISIAGPSIACGGPFNYTAVGPSSYVYTWVITGGSPATATGNNVFVSWGLNSGSVQLTALDPATGCTSTAFLGVEACTDCTPPPLDMVAWWALDEGSGTLAQELVAGNDGTDASAVSPAKVAGAVLNARQFDGATGVVRVPNIAKLNLGLNDLTIDAWMQTSSISPLLGIVEKRLLSPDRGYALYLKQGKLALLLGDGSTITEYWASTASAINDGAWHHVAATENRADNLAGTKLYVDGALVASFPGYPSTASITNTEKVVIGAMEPSALPTGWFAGRIDEVEIFKRALTGAEIAKVWGAGPAGKCKEFVRAPKLQTICNGQTSVTASVKLCNLGSSTQLFNLTFASAPGVGCTGPALTAFQMIGFTNPIPVSAGANNCVTVPVKITRPSGLVNGLTSCYKATSTNFNTGVAHLSKGSVSANDLLCVKSSDTGGGWSGFGVPQTLHWTLTNTSPAFLTMPTLVTAEPADDDEPLPNQALALGGLPPGTPVFLMLSLAPGESTTVAVDAQFELERPFRFYDMTIQVDADFNGEFDAFSSSSLLYNEHPPVTVDVPKPTPATEVRLLGVTPNPFMRAARVNFEMPQPGWVRISLYDVTGRRVSPVREGLAAAGRQSWPLDAARLPSGVYFVRMETAGYRNTARAVLLQN